MKTLALFLLTTTAAIASIHQGDVMTGYGEAFYESAIPSDAELAQARGEAEASALDTARAECAGPAEAVGDWNFTKRRLEKGGLISVTGSFRCL